MTAERVRTVNQRGALAILFVSVALAAPMSRAETFSADALRLKMANNSTAPQKILVIPIVDSSFNYNPANRVLNDTNLPGFPDGLNEIKKNYQVMTEFWDAASYGILDIKAEVAGCFYRTATAFPNAGEAAFKTAYLKSLPLLFQPGFGGPAFERLVIEYTADPLEGVKTITFMSDPAVKFDTSDKLLTFLRAQLVGEHKTNLEITYSGTTSAFAHQGSILIQVAQPRTFLGSMVTVAASSPSASRLALGFNKPALRMTSASATSPVRVAVTSDGAVIPARFRDDSGLFFNFLFSARPGMGNTGAFDWKLTNVNDTPLDQDCNTMNCPQWTNAATLMQQVRPVTMGFSIIRDVVVAGRKEFEFEMAPSGAMPGTVFEEKFRVDSRGSIATGLLGMRFREEQKGTAMGRTVTRESHKLTKEAVQAFLNTELVDDLGCVPTEVLNVGLSNKVAAKAAIDSFLSQYSAIHTFMLTNTGSIRENANYTWMTANLSKGGNTMDYQVATPVAAVEISTTPATIAHEVGHNIGAGPLIGEEGFPDLYDNSNTWFGGPSDYHPNLTFPGTWDIMGNSQSMSYPGGFLRQAFAGWIQGGHGTVAEVKPGETKTFVLTPMERSSTDYDNMLAMPPHPVAKMVKLKLGDDSGKNPRAPSHFIAIENRQPAPMRPNPPEFNNSLPGGGGVTVSDNLGELYTHGALAKPVARNFSHTLTPANASGNFPDDSAPPVMASLDLATTFPGYPGVLIERIGTVDGPTMSDPKSAIVKVTYPTNKVVDAYIEPWVQELSATKAIWFSRATSVDPPQDPPQPADIGNVNVPVVIRGYDESKNGGKPINWVHIKVENRGTFNLSKVRLRLSLNSPGGMGDPVNWQTLSETAPDKGLDIPAGGSKVFSFGWSPTEDLAAKGHTCISAEVLHWEAEGQGQVGDVNPLNNISQENIFQMNVVSGSPWHDVPFQVQVHNAYSHDVPVILEPFDLPEGFSVALDTPTAQLAANSARIFTGSLKWDSTIIPSPTTQNANDGFWSQCSDGEGGDPAFPNPYLPAHCGRVWGLRAFALIGDYRIPIGSVSFQTQGRPVATVTGTTTVGPNGGIVVSGTISPPSTGQRVRVVVRHPDGSHTWVDVPTTSTGSYTTTVPPQGNGPAQLTVEIPEGGGPYNPTRIDDMILGCGFLPEKLNPASCTGGASQVDLGKIPTGCRAEIRSVDGNTLPSPIVLTSGVVTLRPGRYVIHWTATNSALSTKVSADQTVTVAAQDPALCCAANQTTIIGDDTANTFTFTDSKAYCVLARGGQDKVTTPGANDSLFGGPDNDQLAGGTGNDFLAGGDGADNLSCKGNMQAHGGEGADSISANTGKASTMWGGAGADQLVGSPEADTIYPGSGANNTTAGAGNDKIVILNTCEITAGGFIDGGTGTDTLVSPVSLATLRSMGVTVVSIETVQVSAANAHLSDCFPRPPAPAPFCGYLPDWQVGTGYAGGARVEHNTIVYECKPAPVNGWCGQVGYEPGVGATWRDAWLEVGPCF